MAVRVRTNLRGVRTRVSQMTRQGQYALANQVHVDMNFYAPAKSHDLRIQSYVASDNKQVIYNTLYARKQFYNQYSNYTTPGTGPRWDEKAKSIHKQSWEQIAKRAMK